MYYINAPIYSGGYHGTELEFQSIEDDLEEGDDALDMFTLWYDMTPRELVEYKAEKTVEFLNSIFKVTKLLNNEDEVVFKEVNSPREYNFRTDYIGVLPPLFSNYNIKMLANLRAYDGIAWNKAVSKFREIESTVLTRFLRNTVEKTFINQSMHDPLYSLDFAEFEGDENADYFMLELILQFFIALTDWDESEWYEAEMSEFTLTHTLPEDLVSYIKELEAC